MPEEFDPYYEWLGIPAGDQPPTHYRLLGIPALEDHPTVIENAADRQMAHLRTFQAGKHSAESQRLLNDVAAARVCLLNPAKKAAYDERLRQRLAPSSGPAAAPEARSPIPVVESMRTSTSLATSAGRAEKPQPKPTVFIGAAAIAVAVIGLALWWAVGRGGGPGDPAHAKTDPMPPAKAAKEVLPKPPAPPEKKTPVTVATKPKDEVKPAVSPVVSPSERPERKAMAEAMPATQDSTADKPGSDEARAPAKKLDLPSKEEQKGLVRDVDVVYKPGEAKDPAAKVALARKLLEDGRKNEANRNEQFVMLRRAAEIARDGGDADLMLEAVDAMVDAGFDIRPAPVKALLLKQLVAQGTSAGGSPFSALSAACVKFAEAAAAGGAIGEAVDVLDTADKSLAEPKKRAQSVLRAARVAALRARNPADKAAQAKKAAEAQAELDAIDAAQSALAECGRGIQQVRREHEAILAAQERMKNAPDDPDACLAVGRWQCFHQDDWDEGLKLLAKGSDGVLKSVAADELASKPSDAKDRVARGDVWWDLAEKADGNAKAAMRRRAARWYREALADLSPGLGKSKVESRLAQVTEPPEAEGPASRVRPPLAVAPFNEKTAKQHQARWAKYLGVPVVQINSLDMKLALIPPGEFQMGSPKELIDAELKAHGDDKWYKDRLPGERPQHRVRITRPFWLGVTEVTQEEYQHVMGNNPSKFQGDPRRPVEQVSRDDAAEFCRRLSELPPEKAAKRRYGLPTEAQWERACRAGSAGAWSYSPNPGTLVAGEGERLLGEHGWFNANAGGQTHPVASKRPNAWGLYDMYGNVWEWCQDWYDKDYYARSAIDNPTGPAGGSYRVFRGGSWYDPARGCWSASRQCHEPGYRGSNLGLRLSLVSAE